MAKNVQSRVKGIETANSCIEFILDSNNKVKIKKQNGKIPKPFIETSTRENYFIDKARQILKNTQAYLFDNKEKRGKQLYSVILTNTTLYRNSYKLETDIEKGRLININDSLEKVKWVSFEVPFYFIKDNGERIERYLPKSNHLDMEDERFKNKDLASVFVVNIEALSDFIKKITSEGHN